ncbi:MAG TPA: hypothetical protein EYQ25_03365 [Planctomycetes bacterium]|nr:hypothetical protein [Planctomycetota bacterium]HIL36953.1 hypothetical protein [Planctomycetota bacterium]
MSHHRENLLASFGEPDESAFARARDILSAVRAVRSLTVRPLDAQPPRRDMGKILEDHLAGRRLQVGEDLMRHLVGGLQHEDAVIFVGQPNVSWHEGWAQWAVDPKVTINQPDLGESYEQIGTRLLKGLFDMGMHTDRAAIWRARLEHVLGQHERAMASWGTLFKHKRPFAAQARIERAAVELERGQPKECLQDLRFAGGLPGSTRLTAWAHALLGIDHQDAEPMHSQPWPVPAFLVALRERKPEFSLALAGIPRTPGSFVRPEKGLVRSAEALGALVLSVHSLRDGHSQLEFAAVEAGVQTKVSVWGAARRRGWRRGADPARDAMENCSTVFDHRSVSKPSAALHPDTRSVGVVPIVAEDVGVCGWLHVEWPQAPNVCASRLERIAAPWAEHMSLPQVEETTVDNGEVAPKKDNTVETVLDDLELHAPFHNLMQATKRGLGRRRWFGYVLEDGEPLLVATSGKALPLKGEWQGGAGILDRAQRLGGVSTFEGADPQLSIHIDSVGGVALPLKRGDLLIGFFCLEAVRAKSIDTDLLEIFAECAPGAARELEVIRFCRLHRERFHRSLYLPSRVPGFVGLLDRLSRASASKGPILLVGPAGCGKATLSRWGFHLRGLGVARRFDGRNFRRSEVGDGPIFLTQPEFLSREGQALLLDLICSDQGRNLILSTSSDPNNWKWNSDLLDLVLRCRVDVEGLDRRRDELFAWIPGLLQLHAREESCDPPRLSEEAFAWLWRLPWKGGLRELSEAMSTLVIQANEIDLDLEQTMDLLRPMGIPRDRKLPLDARSYPALNAARVETCTADGRVNVAGVARLMGWDKATVSSRLKRAEIE